MNNNAAIQLIVAKTTTESTSMWHDFVHGLNHTYYRPRVIEPLGQIGLWQGSTLM